MVLHSQFLSSKKNDKIQICEIYKECVACDLFECVRILRRGRPVFMHYIEHQKLYISSRISRCDITQTLQHCSCLSTANILKIEDHHEQHTNHIRSFINQYDDEIQDDVYGNDGEQGPQIPVGSSIKDERHLLAILPNTRHKIPKT